MNFFNQFSVNTEPIQNPNLPNWLQNIFVQNDEKKEDRNAEEEKTDTINDEQLQAVNIMQVSNNGTFAKDKTDETLPMQLRISEDIPQVGMLQIEHNKTGNIHQMPETSTDSFSHVTFDNTRTALSCKIEEVRTTFIHSTPDKLKALVDPRDGRIKYNSDHSYRKQYFLSVNKSKLSKAEHLGCLRYCQALQRHETPAIHDWQIWQKCDIRRSIEKYQVQEQAKESINNAGYGEQINRLNDLYTLWFQQTMQQWLLHKEPIDLQLNCISAFPIANYNHKQISKDSNMSTVTLPYEISEVQLLMRKGHVPVYEEELYVNFEQLDAKFEQLSQQYVQALPATQADLCNLERELNAAMKLHATNIAADVSYSIPFETLLFLLTTHECVDLPKQVLLQIEPLSADAECKKLITFEQPLPTNDCGWHCWNMAAEMAFSMHLSNTADWLYVHNSDVSCLPKRARNAATIQATGFKVPYKLMTHEEYAQQMPAKINEDAWRLKFNRALFNWQLLREDKQHLENTVVQFYTVMQLPPVINEKAQQFINGHNIKLEYKPLFGCEQKTKYELYKELLQLQFMQAINMKQHETVDDKINTSRIDTKSFQLQLLEQCNERDIQLQLRQHEYAVKFQLVLQKLHDMLTQLSGMPNGKYMLAVKPTHPQVLLLYAPSNVLTPNTVSLHELFQTIPNKIQFKLENPYLPISDRLVSIVHEHNHVAPCMFSLRPLKAKKWLLVDDRQMILDRNRQQMQQKKQQKQLQHKKRKYKKQKERKRAKQLKAAKEQMEQQALFDSYNGI